MVKEIFIQILMFVNFSGIMLSCGDTQPPLLVPTVNRLPGPCTETAFNLAGEIVSQDVYHYDESNCLVEHERRNYGLISDLFIQKILCNEYQRPISTVFDVLSDGLLDGVRQLEYDDSLNVVVTREGRCESNSVEECFVQNVLCTEKIIYEYTSEGMILHKLIDEVCDGVIQTEESFEYMSTGNQLVVVQSIDSVHITGELDGSDDMINRFTFQDGLVVIEEYDFDADGIHETKRSFKYNEFGDQVLVQNIDPAGDRIISSTRSQYEYDEDINIIQRIDSDISGKVTRRFVFDYSCWF